MAREQTAGRGRQGRQWTSPAGEGLYFSVILRPEIKPSESAVLTLAAAVAVAETLGQDFKIDCDIKWPNDVLISGRKVCGILVESAVEKDRIQYAIMGIGVNVSQRSFPKLIENSATSILIEAGLSITPEEFLTPLLERLQQWCDTAVTNPERVSARWEELSSYARDCAVRVESSDWSIEGVTRGLTQDGALVVELASGETRVVVSGEVSLRAQSSN